MSAESLAIMAVILVMAGMFVRAKKQAVALITLPLISVPLFYLLSAVAFRLSSGSITFNQVRIGMVVVGLVIGCALCTACSRMIPTRRGKAGYLFFTLFFQAALSLAYILSLI